MLSHRSTTTTTTTALVAALVASAFIAAPARAASDYFEDWEGGDTAGWFANTIDSTVVHSATGGNPDGQLLTRGPAPGPFPIGATTEVAPLTGSYAGFLWTASFDLLQPNGAPTELALRFRYRDFTFNGWKYAFDPLPNGNTWTTYTVSFDPMWTDAQALAAGWVTDLPGGSGSVSWAQTMSDVYRTEIRLTTGTDSLAGIDNFRMQSRPVPEPSTWAALGAGLAALGLVARRRRRV
jgi:hypothetical protein